jgi:lipopolysaccharide transport system ATP-binding protein
MSDIAIKVEDVGKLYRLGEIGTGTISHDLNRWWARVRGKEDPFSKVGEVNDRTTKGKSDYVWALKDVNFEVRQGEVLGIIGRNGAGKSTLLKILSKVTSPSAGHIKIKGRIASLLEVGTGFHPELTGRENIYLNGAILGMSKREIQSKFDEIVDFSGVERYIDTPVKRYSSGMYVRLAFAVAAFLEPEILIVDEVLAVGDAEFQKKCLGRMKDVSVNDGRTVLFVSHDMAAVSTLTTHALCLKNGSVALNSNTEEVIKYYLENTKAAEGIYESRAAKDYPSITKVQLVTSSANNIHINGEPLYIDIDVNMNETIEGMALSLQIFNEKEVPIIFTYVFDVDKPILRLRGTNKMRCIIPECNLYQGKYYLKVHLAESKGRTKFQEIDKICQFEVNMMNKIIEWGWQKNVCIYTEKFDWVNK